GHAPGRGRRDRQVGPRAGRGTEGGRGKDGRRNEAGRTHGTIPVVRERRTGAGRVISWASRARYFKSGNAWAIDVTVNRSRACTGARSRKIASFGRVLI